MSLFSHCADYRQFKIQQEERMKKLKCEFITIDCYLHFSVTKFCNECKEIIEYINTNIFTENTFFKLYFDSSQPKRKTIPPTKTRSLEKQ